MWDNETIPVKLVEANIWIPKLLKKKKKKKKLHLFLLENKENFNQKRKEKKERERRKRGGDYKQGAGEPPMLTGFGWGVWLGLYLEDVLTLTLILEMVYLFFFIFFMCFEFEQIQTTQSIKRKLNQHFVGR